VRDGSYPNHAGSVHDAHGQKYPVEAGPSGYARGDFDEYRTEHARIVRVMRWVGFDEPWRRDLAGQILERWARHATSPKYDWAGAVLSSRLGRWLFPSKSRQAVTRLFCSEGVVYLHAMCGLVDGITLPPETPLSQVEDFITAHPECFPRSRNPVDVLMWMAARGDFREVFGLYTS
jgi:hypothetical protein